MKKYILILALSFLVFILIDVPTSATVRKTGSQGDYFPLTFHFADGDVPAVIDVASIKFLFDPQHHDIQGLDSPTVEFTSGEPFRLEMDLFFDSYEEGKDVREYTDKIEKLAVNRSDTEIIEIKDGDDMTIKSPECVVMWGDKTFKCVIEQAQTRFTLFLDDGTPVRAIMNVLIILIPLPLLPVLPEPISCTLNDCWLFNNQEQVLTDIDTMQSILETCNQQRLDALDSLQAMYEAASAEIAALPSTDMGSIYVCSSLPMEPLDGSMGLMGTFDDIYKTNFNNLINDLERFCEKPNRVLDRFSDEIEYNLCPSDAVTDAERTAMQAGLDAAKAGAQAQLEGSQLSYDSLTLQLNNFETYFPTAANSSDEACQDDSISRVDLRNFLIPTEISLTLLAQLSASFWAGNLVVKDIGTTGDKLVAACPAETDRAKLTSVVFFDEEGDKPLYSYGYSEGKLTSLSVFEYKKDDPATDEDESSTIEIVRQYDIDSDGVGDVCDPCPMDAGNNCERTSSAIIGPEGGTIIVSDPEGDILDVTLLIPRGAWLPSDGPGYTHIFASSYDLPAEPIKTSFGLITGPTYDFGPDGLTFQQLVNITADVGPCLSAEGEIFEFQQAEGTWAPKGAVFDSTTNTLIFQTTHFSRYAVGRKDITPPETSLSVSPTELWPPNHKMFEIAVNLKVTDDYDPDPAVTLEVTSSEPDDAPGDGDGNTINDIQIIDGKIFLRAERAGGGTGRTYTITYKTTDISGNSASKSAIVFVPHDKGKK